MGMNLQRSSFQVSLAAETSSGGWIQIFPLGKQQTFDGRGPYTLDDPEAVVAASMGPATTARKQVDLVVDRDHAHDLLPAGAERPAAGWIKELEVRADGIYGRIEWTARAAQQIADREYRYFSPTFLHTKEGKVLRILRGSLVNNPNLEIKAVAAAESEEQPNPQQEKKTMNETLKAIAKLLGLPDDATEAAVLEAVKALQGDYSKIKDSVGATASADAAAILKLIDAKVSTASEQAKGGKVDPSKFVPIEQFTELQKSVASMQESNAKEKAQEAVDAAIKAGKIAPAVKEWALSYASEKPDEFKKFVDASPVIVAAGAVDDKGKVTTAAALDDEQKSMCSQLGITAEQFAAAKTKNA